MKKINCNYKACLLYIFLFWPFFLVAQDWEQIGDSISGFNIEEYSGGSLGLNYDGNIIVIGAANRVSSPSLPGFARVYSLNDNNEWNQIGETLEGDEIGDGYGLSVSINDEGNIVAVGAPMRAMDQVKLGYVRVFENNAGEWNQLGSDILAIKGGEGFGFRLKLNADGTVLAITAPFSEGHKGMVRIFKLLENEWVQLGQSLEGSNENERFGSDISINGVGDIIAMGSTHNSDNGLYAGCAKIYQYINSEWVQMGSTIYGLNGNDFFGQAVDLNKSGNIVAIGSTNANDYRGHVRIFEFLNEAWVQTGNTIIGKGEDDLTGANLCLNDIGDIVAIAAPVSHNFYQFDGRINVYKLFNGIWNEMGNAIYGEHEIHTCGTASLNGAGTRLAASSWMSSLAVGHTRVFDFVCAENHAPIPFDDPLSDLFSECGALSVSNIPVAFDKCGDGIFATTSDPLYYDEVGEYTITWLYEDNYGNSATQIQSVIIIEDNIPPVINCKNDFSVLVDFGETEYYVNNTELDPISFLDNCEVKEVYNNINGESSLNGETFSLGIHEITWTIEDVNGHTSSCQFFITVEETIPTYVISYSAETGGNIIGEQVQHVQHGEDGTPVEAVPLAGYVFSEWSDGSKDNPRVDANVIEDISVSAVFDEAVFVNYLYNQNVSVYPNPFNDYLFIECDNSFDKIIVRNLYGFVVMEKNINMKLYINLSHLASGIYIIELFSVSDFSKTVKIITKY